ncbi:MAG: cobyrinate a,c-diamide synthase [Ruminococcus sp.]|nr:cobyrinate a,c-diamide synthase [Ruminococcus sp.]
MSRFMIAGTKSGSGKTTVTCAVLSALKKRGLDVASFKCGPDYIDPMFHRQVIGVRSHNLDSFFCDDDTLRYILCENSRGCSAAVIEGVMGFYDGGDASAHSVSAITGTPVILVIDCKGMSDSIGAVMSGFLNYRKPNNIIGFIFNRLPEKLVPLAKRLCSELNTGYFGFLPQNDITLESRHLGLVTADEVRDISDKVAMLGELAEKHLCTDSMLALENTGIPAFAPPCTPTLSGSPVIAAARDKAFCFMYSESIELLEKMGCTVRFFSPLTDSRLPDADGLLLCGGYPELYAEELSRNRSLLDSIRERILGGMPVIAECGGFMYLHERLKAADGRVFQMAGVIKGEVFPTSRLQRFGYITMTAAEDNLLCKRGGTIKAHEFHYWDSTSCGSGFTAEKRDGRSWSCVHASKTMYAGFPHIYLCSDTGIAQSFAEACIAYGGKNGQDITDKTSR